MFFGHVAEAGMDEGIRKVGHPGKIKHHRFHSVPDTFNLERAKLVPKVAIGEELAEFIDHLEFEFHKISGLRKGYFRSFECFLKERR